MPSFVLPVSVKKINRSQSLLVLFSLLIFLLCQSVSSFVVSKDFGVINNNYIFGLFGADYWPWEILIFLLLVLLIFLAKRGEFNILWCVLISGAFSNLADRIIRGGVVDYIRVDGLPIFNLPDIIIVFSVLLLSIITLIRKTPQ